MLSTARRAANTWFAAVALSFTYNIITTTANCVSWSSPSTAGNPELISIDDETFFACADGSFLVAVEASYFSSISSLSWTCSDKEESGSAGSSLADGAAVSFTVGISGVQTGVKSVDEGIALPLLAEMYISGYDVDSGHVDGVSFSWKGPFGTFGEDEEPLQGLSGSYCGDSTFATGVTVWASSNFVYGVRLECAAITDTCAPPSYPASLVEDTPDSSAGGSSSDATGLVVIISAVVGGSLLLIAIAVGVGCCICHRCRESEARHHERIRQAAAAVVVPTTAKETRGDAGDNKGVPLPADDPPPPYFDPSRYQ